jgi:hypothetical protein
MFLWVSLRLIPNRAGPSILMTIAIAYPVLSVLNWATAVIVASPPDVHLVPGLQQPLNRIIIWNQFLSGVKARLGIISLVLGCDESGRNIWDALR